MRFMCVCQGGNVRSVAMAIALKNAGQEALAAGWETAAGETLNRWIAHETAAAQLFKR